MVRLLLAFLWRFGDFAAFVFQSHNGAIAARKDGGLCRRARTRFNPTMVRLLLYFKENPRTDSP